MNSQTPTTTATVSAATRRGERRLQHTQNQQASVQRRERAQERHAQAGERRVLLGQLDRGRGVTDTLAAVAQEQDTPHDQVRRARLLRDVLHEIDSGTLAVRGLSPRKTTRFLAFLEREIAWLENLAGGTVNPGQTAAIAA